MGQTTNREGMRKALDALRIGRPADIAAADFNLVLNPGDCRPSISWADFGVREGDKVQWVRDAHTDAIAVRVILREEAPIFVDLMAA